MRRSAVLGLLACLLLLGGTVHAQEDIADEDDE